ncbi:MAG: hypothetical protein ACRC0Y_03920 [Fusobacteriaceae bacterium]
MKIIKGYENYYATTCGCILSKKTGRRLITYLDTVGYGCVNVRDSNGIVKHFRVHRLVASTFLEFDRGKKNVQVNHIDGNKANCCILNLEKLTNKENTEHGYDCNLYTTRNRIEIKVIEKTSGKIFQCKSMRECETLTGVNRKLISLYIKGIRCNVSAFSFEISCFDKPFRIIDSKGTDFRSIRQCALEYGFSEKIFTKVSKLAENVFSYKGYMFVKYFV